MERSKSNNNDLNDKIHRSHLQALMGRTVSGTNQDFNDDSQKAGSGNSNKGIPTLPHRGRHITPKLPDRGMEFLHEKKDYNVAEFYEHFNNDLPKTVMVNQGFCGEIVEDTFDREQVLRVHAISKQRRVIAKFQYGTHSRLISIPVSYDERLCVVKQGGKHGKPKPIYTILKDYTMPLTVQFPKDHTITVGNQTVSTNNIPCMELVQTFDEVYLLANFITDGVMSQEVVHVPLYLSQLRLAVITGIKGQSKEKWKGYQEELDRAATCIEFDEEFGNPNIAEYDPSAIHSDSTYSYVEPTAYSNIVSLVNKSPLKSFDNATYGREQKQNEENPSVYEEIDNTARDNKTTPDKHAKQKDKPNPNPALKKELDAALQPNETKPQLKSFNQHPQTKIIPPPPPVAPKPYIDHDSSPALPERRAMPGLPKHTSTTRATSTTQAGHALYQNDVPRTKISPTMQTTTGPESKPLPKPLPKDEEKKVIIFKKVQCQDDVMKLTIDEVTEYLKKLNLEKYADTFKSEQIDGPMLSELDSDILKEDFGMKGVEALRLLKFAKDGHVPN